MDYFACLDYREASEDALLAQLVEHSIRNAGVRSSNLLGGTTFSIKSSPQTVFFHHRQFHKISIKLNIAINLKDTLIRIW